MESFVVSWYNNRVSVIIPSYGQDDSQPLAAHVSMANYTTARFALVDCSGKPSKIFVIKIETGGMVRAGTKKR